MRGSASVASSGPAQVALRRATRGARRAVDRGLGDLDHEVAAAGELLEVVAGDVGVELEVLGDLAGGDAGGAGVAGEQVDLAAGRVTERVGDRAHHRVELVGGEGFGRLRSATGILPTPVVEIPWEPPHGANPSLDVQAALAAVEEPELRRSIVELGMVQGVAVDGTTAVVAIAAPLPGDASRAELSPPGRRGGRRGARASSGSTSTSATWTTTSSSPSPAC